ncbi:hypothetical protein OIU77_024502 [Salix suchowensis]|uniref:Uncharacterized protein n=1 Tax=Salix suchowensis TaxID=1278906 RepID=A0ABQ9BTK6_9ROSI|nr:hypothetical protein OIU77_024502 [Salix suchowensis]
MYVHMIKIVIDGCKENENHFFLPVITKKQILWFVEINRRSSLSHTSALNRDPELLFFIFSNKIKSIKRIDLTKEQRTGRVYKETNPLTRSIGMEHGM